MPKILLIVVHDDLYCIPIYSVSSVAIYAFRLCSNTFIFYKAM